MAALQSLPLVSIIIPTYNMRRFIAEAVDSALAQTYPRVEVIVVDDGSTDGTGEFLREKYGHRIRYVYQENKGRGAARNHGLRLARGEYIQFLDADDLLYPHKLTQHVTYLDAHPEYAAVYGHCLVAWEDDLAHHWDSANQSYYASGDILEQEIHHPFLWLIMVLVRRAWIERVGGLDETLHSNEDWDLWLRIAHAGGLFAYLPSEPVALHRKPRLIPEYKATYSVHLHAAWLVLGKIEQAMDPGEVHRLRVPFARANYQFGYGCFLSQEGHRLRGCWEMIKSLRHNRASLSYKLLNVGLRLALSPLTADRILDWLQRRLGRHHGRSGPGADFDKIPTRPQRFSMT